MAVVPFIVLLAAAAPAQSVQEYDLHVLPNLSSGTFGGSTNIGPIVGNPSNQVQVAGLVTLRLSPAGGPFTSGEFVDAHVFTIPSTLNAKIPNPIPFLPPLATMEVIDGVFNVISPGFPIDPAGNFTATVTMGSSDGRLLLHYLGITTEYALAGGFSSPSTVSGTLTASGTRYSLNLPLDLRFDVGDPNVGITGYVSILGTVGGVFDLADPPLVLRLPPLYAGFSNNFTVTGAQPGGQTFLVYGLEGLGNTFVPQLGVTLGLQNPQQAGTMRRASPGGVAAWSLFLPFGAAGRTIRFQAAQVGDVSNIWLTTVF